MQKPWPDFVPEPKRPIMKPKVYDYKPKKQLSNVIEPVSVNLVVKGDKVKLRLNCLSYEIYEKYLLKGKKPPMMEYIRSLVKMGLSEDKINQVYESYKKWNNKEYLDKLESDINRIWPGPKAKRKEPIVKKVLKAVKKY